MFVISWRQIRESGYMFFCQMPVLTMSDYITPYMNYRIVSIFVYVSEVCYDVFAQSEYHVSSQHIPSVVGIFR